MTGPIPDDVTLGEIFRGLGSLEGRMNEKFNQVNRRLDTLEFVPRGEHTLQVKELGDRITDLEDSKKWITRSLVAAFLFPTLVAIVVAMVVVR